MMMTMMMKMVNFLGLPSFLNGLGAFSTPLQLINTKSLSFFFRFSSSIWSCELLSWSRDASGHCQLGYPCTAGESRVMMGLSSLCSSNHLPSATEPTTAHHHLPEERGVQRGSARRSISKCREKKGPHLSDQR